jgi:phosphoribosylaminoimidazole-succinocarboxamide synthase
MASIEEVSVTRTSMNLPGQVGVYHGKVRDVYDLGEVLVMVATDRISAFDHILPRPVPFKGQVLNQIARYFLEATAEIVPNWLLASPDPNVSIGRKANPIRIEMVVRGYLAGHAWRTYKEGKRTLCGVPLPDGLKENDPLPQPVITPTTKADQGHDMDISAEEILAQGIVSEKDWATLVGYANALFAKGSEMALERGLILVDTKYEFGRLADEIILIDEIHTPDSSRYFHASGYQERQDQNLPQPQLSKEFVREWLISHQFQGLDGQTMPELPDDFVWDVSKRYIQLFETVTGKTFDRISSEDIESRIENNVLKYLQSH